MDYDDNFKNCDNVFGNKPTFAIKLVLDNWLIENISGNFLDLGAGQGRDSLYMANHGFNVYTIDISQQACDQIKEKITNEGLQNIQVSKADIKDLTIEENKFDIISAYNVLQFLKKNDALRIINKIKSSLKISGLVVISLFIKSDGFSKQELLHLFKDYEIIYYFESIIVDNGHYGDTEKHTHHIARIVARKI